jgi:hypothetical protein
MIAVPQFAPLAAPMVLHLLPSNPNRNDFQQLLLKVITIRREIVMRMEERLDDIRRSSSPTHVLQGPLQAILAEKVKKREEEAVPEEQLFPEEDPEYSGIVRSTFTDWRKRNLLLREFNPDNIGALLTAAACDDRLQGYLPTFLEQSEPRWWCFSIAPPYRDKQGVWQQSPVLPCPVPLPHNLKPGTLLVSPWPVYEQGWTAQGFYGALRFWQLSENAIAAWDPQLIPRFSPTKKIKDKYMFKMLSESLLMSKIQEFLLAPNSHLFTTFDPGAYSFDLDELLTRICICL